MWEAKVLCAIMVGGCALSLQACGNEPKTSNGVPPNAVDAGPVDTPEPTPLALDAGVGCTIDAECQAGKFCFQNECAFECVTSTDCGDGESCSPRGRCETQAQKPSLAEVVTSAAAASAPQTEFAVLPGQAQVSFRLNIAGSFPGASLAYTISRADSPNAVGKVERAAVKGADGAQYIEIPIDVGLGAANSTGAKTINVVAKTSLGAFRLALVPQQPISGAYSGTVNMDVFGPAGLPLAFEVLTDPPEATLAQAKQAWMILPVDDAILFSPINASPTAPTAVAAPLTFDNWLNRWVAVFENPFVLQSGILTAPADQTNRVLRFELEPLDATHLVGRMVDRWEGLFDARSALGVVEPDDLVLTGDVQVEQLGRARSIAELPSITAAVLNKPKVWSLPALDACDASVPFPTVPVTSGSETTSCGTITTVDGFVAATPADQAACAITAVATALAGSTTTAALKSYLDKNSSNPSGLSFAQFIENCAKGVNGTCVPSAAVLCSRQLAAYAYRNQPDGTTISSRLIDAFHSATQEALLGRQLAAFKNDADTRLNWLKTTDYPAIVTSAVRSLNEQLLADWQAGVLDVHTKVLSGYLDRAGMAVLSQSTSEAAASEARSALLAQVVQSWRATMDALTVGAQRWNELYDRATDRATKASDVQRRVRDLYLSAAAMVRFARDSGAGYQATAFGAGFSNLMRAQSKLSQSFDELVFSRDAEVVVSSSLDPSSTNKTLLAERADAATAAVTAAATSVSSVLAAVQAEALDETQLRNRLDNEINALRDELVDLCGLPKGCTAAEFRTNAECRVLVKPGMCGFTVARGTNAFEALDNTNQNVSQAGRSVLAIVGALNEQQIAQESLRAHLAKLDLELRDLDAFAADVQTWNQTRLSGLESMGQLLDALKTADESEVAGLVANLSAKVATRTQKVDGMRTALADWAGAAKEGAQTSLWKELAVIAAEKTSDFLESKASFIESKAEAAADGLPKSVGTSTDPSSAGRLAIKTSSSIAVYALKAAKIAVDYGKSKLEASLKQEEELHTIKLTEMKETATIEEAVQDNELARFEEQARINAKITENQKQALRDLYERGREQRAAELAYARDVAELRTRRSQYLQRLQEGAELDLRVQRAKATVDQRIADYLGVAQRAEISNAKLNDLDAQRGNVLQIVGSPGAFFARTNRVAQAESQLSLAKDAMMEWLVALEYFAVRPFMDQRVQVLLARNPYQLQQIATQLTRLQNGCGGAVNRSTAVLSIRKDLLGLTRPLLDQGAQEPVSADERFRLLLQSGNIPIDKRVRYTTDSSIGQLMDSDRSVLAATFDISLDDFANLAASCNAKIEGVMVQFVGKIGAARPTATVLYDGTSRVRSCQPKLAEYIDLIGAGRTHYAPITSFRTQGRAASPVAGLNQWPADTELNKSFGGLPLASQYTVLIDTSIGENANLDFGKLDDILLRIDYTYSDFFPSGSCE